MTIIEYKKCVFVLSKFKICRDSSILPNMVMVNGVKFVIIFTLLNKPRESFTSSTYRLMIHYAV